MARTKISRASKIGKPPGTLVHIGEYENIPVEISVIDYNAEFINEHKIGSFEQIQEYLDSDTVSWINISGVHDTDLVAKLGAMLGIHSLTQEDIVNTHQRPKVEIHENYIFVVIKMISFDQAEDIIDIEQVSLIIGKNYVLTFQEKPGDVFDPIRDRLRTGKGRIRKSGADFLGYALIDVIVDHYFIALEGLGMDIEDLEDELVTNPGPETLQTIHELKRALITMRKSVWPVRELVATLERSESDLINDAVNPYLRDIYDHAIQVIDTTETLRDIISGYIDIYLSSISNRMNEVMKVLTIIATIFIPLTFVAGIYGMNFEHMPELKWEWGYPVALGVMALIGITMLVYFKRKKWL